MLYDDLVQSGEYICHYGIKGQKWGVRRYQNPDGSLTPEGKARYYSDGKITEQGAKRLSQLSRSWSDTFKSHLEYGGLIKEGLSNKQISNIRNYKVKEIKDKQNQIKKAVEKDPNLQTKRRILNAYDKYSNGIDDQEAIDLFGVKGLVKSFAYDVSKYPESYAEYLKTNPQANKIYNEYRSLKNQRDEMVRNSINDLLGEYSTFKINNNENLSDFTIRWIQNHNLLIR